MLYIMYIDFGPVLFSIYNFNTLKTEKYFIISRFILSVCAEYIDSVLYNVEPFYIGLPYWFLLGRGTCFGENILFTFFPILWYTGLE